MSSCTLGHGDEEGLARPARELLLHVLLATAEHDRRDTLRELVQIAVAERAAPVVQLVELPVEAKERTEEVGVQELDDGVDLVDPVLERRAGQDEGVAALELLYRSSGLRLPVLDTLGLVEDDYIGPQRSEQIFAVGNHLLVVAEGEERVPRIRCAAGQRAAEHHRGRQVGEGGDLLLPFGLERSRRHHQDPLDSAKLAQQCARRDGLHGLAEPHVVGEQGALAEREVENALDLVRQQRKLQKVERTPPRREQCLETRPLAAFARRRPMAVDPALHTTGDAKQTGLIERDLMQCAERPSGTTAQTAIVRLGFPYQLGVTAGDLARHRHLQGPVTALVEKHLDAPACLATLRGEGAYAVRMVPHAFDVLAGPQPVDPVVLALAGIDPFPERADLDHVCAAARRSDPVVPERSKALVERLHGFNLGPAPPLSTPYLVLVRGEPSLEGRWPSLRLGPALASRVRSSLTHVPTRAPLE